MSASLASGSGRTGLHSGQTVLAARQELTSAGILKLLDFGVAKLLDNHVGADLHTVAHEAAHVVHQREGVQLKGGVGAVACAPSIAA
jgi:hypothetical protein